MSEERDRAQRAGLNVSVSRRALLTRSFLAAGALGASALVAACGGGDSEPTATSGSSTSSSAGAPTATKGAGGAAAPTTAPPAPTTAPAPTVASASAPKKGGTLKTAVVGDPIPWPFSIPGAVNSIISSKTLFNMLTKYSKTDLSPQPDLAEKWEANSQGTEWTFSLRKDVKWHDGQAFSADDVKFTYEAMIAKDSNAYSRSNFTALQSIEVVDPATVKMVYKQPVAAVPVLVGYVAAIVPKHLLESQDMKNPTEFIKNPIGTGPFKFKEFLSGDHLTVVANPDYFLGPPLLDSIIIKVIPDLNVQVAQLQTGELDLAFVEPPNAEDLKTVKDIDLRNGIVVMYTYLGGVNTKPPFDDVKVRQALNYALDRQAILEQVVAGYGILATGPLTPFVPWAYDKDLKPYPFDQSKAKQLLSDAGWKPGADGILEKDGKKFSVSFMVDKGNAVREQIATITQQYYKQIGIDVKLDVQEFNVMITKLRASEFEMIGFYFVLPPDPDLEGYYSSTASRNYWKYSNPDVDKLLAEGSSTVDQTKRAAIYKQIQHQIYEDAPLVFLYYPYEIQAINKKIQGVPVLGSRDMWPYCNEFWISA